MHAVQLASSIVGTEGLQEGELRLAAVTDNLGKEEASCSVVRNSMTKAGHKPFKKGFLDAKPRSSKASFGQRVIEAR